MAVHIRQTNTSMYDQLMERLDGIGGTTGSASATSSFDDGVAVTTAPPVVSTSVPTTEVIPNSGTSSIPYISPLFSQCSLEMVLGSSKYCRVNRKWIF